MKPDSPAQSLRRARHKPEAFSEFYEAHVQPLHAYVSRRVYDQDVALDIVAETFAQAYRSRRRFRGTSDGQAGAWLYGIARRQVALYFRRRKVERRALKRLAITVPSLDDEQRSQLDELAAIDDFSDELALGLERLSEAQREVLRLRVVQEMPYSEVARCLGITEGAARVRVTRALKVLSDAFDHKPRPQEA